MQQMILLIDMTYSVRDLDNPDKVFIQVLASDVMGIPPDELIQTFKPLVTHDQVIAIVSHDIFTGEATSDTYFLGELHNGN